ncbi:CaiB/BaiF CoA-transferase family protein [Pseudonocardia yunnanensis]|uniref:CaiB/BaiF CoA-transferase family protein n=1 Tax=Pseudonocardia yunnanensis TaxID=58107 RepID=A0ABW4F7T2_9PSEU
MRDYKHAYLGSYLVVLSIRRDGGDAMPNTLSETLVVCLEQALAAPLASCRLADSGARVIKVERPDGGDFARGYDSLVHGDSTYFVWANRGKESVALDLKAPGDLEILLRIIDQADVFIQNLAPGAVDRLGLSSATLRARNPHLITCDISGYGRDGPLRDDKAYDLLIQAESGVASVTGTPDAPGRIGVSACDIAAGLSAHAAILEALLLRVQTGEGSGIHVSLFAAMAEWMAVPLLHHQHSGRQIWPRLGLSHPLIAPYGAYPCADGGLVMVGLQNDAEWRRLASVVLSSPDLADNPDYATNVARVENREAVDQLVSQYTSSVDLDTATGALRKAGIACARVNDVRGLAEHPQLRNLVVTTPGGTALVPAPPALWSVPAAPVGAVPSLDQHGEAIRAEFGTSS